MIRLTVVALICLLLGIILGQEFASQAPPEVSRTSVSENEFPASLQESRDFSSPTAEAVADIPATPDPERQAQPIQTEIDSSWRQLLAQARNFGPNARLAQADISSDTLDKLIDEGVDRESAQWALGLWDRLSEARFEALGAADLDFARLQTATMQTIRRRLGDSNHESFLESIGLPTSVFVPGIAAGSAGDSAGLQPGDEIVRYDDQRVFDAYELTGLAQSGTAGQPVRLEVIRNGAPYTLTIERGPLGISRGAGSQIPIF